MREDDGDVVSTGKDSGKASGMTADDYTEDSSIASNGGSNNDDSKHGNYVPEELQCSDESDFDYSFNNDKQFFTSFSKNKSPNNNRIEGGPTKPDVTNMSDVDAKNIFFSLPMHLRPMQVCLQLHSPSFLVER